MHTFQIGQRWISEMEPELGLGIIQSVEKNTVRLVFPASQTERQYVIEHAPIKRVAFNIGDDITTREGNSLHIAATEIHDGIITYNDEHGRSIPETELSDLLSFTTPHDRLINDFFDKNREFNLRYRATRLQHTIRKSPARGFIGGRIDLIPHQMYVTHEVASRHIPRVLLSDEVGLGKTIEACLIIHRLLLSGRIDRVLILVPPTLVHQWFIELYRRFNLIFRILDEDECEQICEHDTFANPFLETQLAICSTDFLIHDEEWHDLAIEAGWDMLVIDEAHHITEGSDAYKLAERLSEQSKGLLLLTATPEQLGHRSHFARLRLLDPARYYDFDEFENESSHYHDVAQIVNKLLDGQGLKRNEWKGIIPEDQDIESLQADEHQRNAFVSELLDRYGMGRAVFRNTRASMTGFPTREAHLIPLTATDNELIKQSSEFEDDTVESDDYPHYDYSKDPRIKWLAGFLKSFKQEKVLLICHSLEKVVAIDEALRKHIKVNISLFHEELSLLQRDRNAAWFANPNGAQVLICSEIGSEGRNFQFCHQLVLFDIPLDPELLEQRIGRLDRIGQTETIFIHIPFIENSQFAVLARWYHDGLNAFETNVTGAYQVFQEVRTHLLAALKTKDRTALDALITATRHKCAEISTDMETGRNRLLELNSFRSDTANQLIKRIRSIDNDRSLDKFMQQMFRAYDIRLDELNERSYNLNLTALSNPEFPLPTHQHDHITVTYSREQAMHREDIEFLTWDHPMVIGAIDLLLGSEKGNCAYAIWPGSDDPTLLLETVFIVECVVPKTLHVDRFLPPTPIRVVVNHEFTDCSGHYPFTRIIRFLKNSDRFDILNQAEVKQKLIPGMLKRAEQIAEPQRDKIIEDARHDVESSLNEEINRLVELKKVNPAIKQEEISTRQTEQENLKNAIITARLRLDALRLIVKGDV